MSYDLYKILDKKNVTMDELHQVVNDNRVASVSKANSNKWKYDRYDVTLNNGEIYILYVKRNLFGIIYN